MISKISLPLFMFVLLTAMLSCKSKEVATKKENYNLTPQTKIIKKKTYNQDKSMLLVTRYKDDINPRKKINYKVLDSKSKKTLKKGIFIGMKLEWFTVNQLQGHKYVGMVQQQNDEDLLDDSKNGIKNIIVIDIK